MFGDIILNDERPYYLQIKDYIKEMILKGIYQRDVKLPPTRELASLLNVSRNTIIKAYRYLEDEGFIYNVEGKGTYVSNIDIKYENRWNISWKEKLSTLARKADELDIVKHDVEWKKGMISFKSIAPDDSLFDLGDFKKAFLNRISIEGDKILNYGYARGYKPLIDYLIKYIENKGVNAWGKDILITNGFTEGFDIVLSALTEPGDGIICENPTHNTAIKIMKLHELDIAGIGMDDDGINLDRLKNRLQEMKIKLAYLVPSYHNPTGIVMTPEKRIEVFSILKSFNIPIIEDGFNEELRYSGSHISPIAALAGEGNSVIYIGSFSKVLYPGIRIGWILGDRELISYLESVKRSRNIHTSFLDQAILYEYLKAGNFEKYINKARRVYREKYEWAVKCAKEYIPCKKILGEGGLHIFIELDGMNARNVLKECMSRGVIFTPGDIFYTDGNGENTLRLGFSRVDFESIEKGFNIIGEVIKNMNV